MRRGARLLLTGAGSGPSENLAHSLRAGDRRLVILGCHHDRFSLRKSSGARNYLVCEPGHPRYLRSLARVVELERVDLVIPTSDGDVAALAGRRAAGRVFLPSRRVVDLCQDKYELNRRLEAGGVAVPRTLPITGLSALDAVCRRLGRGRKLWCRIRNGSGSAGATPVGGVAQARSWIRYWHTMRGIDPSAFTLSEYLPGRDFGCQSLWRDGRLILLKVFERLAYVSVGGNPSGVSSAAALARTVRDPRVAETCVAAVRAIDRTASGVFGIDLKENAAGVPCVTEINAGRFLAGTNLLDLSGRHNMAVTYVRLALGGRVHIDDPFEAAEDRYMVRSLDTRPGVFTTGELFASIRDART